VLSRAAHNDDASVARRLDDPDSGIDGVDDDAGYLVFLITVGGRHDEPRADLELLVLHGTSEAPEGAEFRARRGDRPHTIDDARATTS